MPFRDTDTEHVDDEDVVDCSGWGIEAARSQKPLYPLVGYIIALQSMASYSSRLSHLKCRS